jgi:carotenoid cleavage dioxygenase-like enzyme
MIITTGPPPSGSPWSFSPAQDVTAEPIARVHLPTRIPFGFHGSWISDQ